MPFITLKPMQVTQVLHKAYKKESMFLFEQMCVVVLFYRSRCLSIYVLQAAGCSGYRTSIKIYVRRVFTEGGDKNSVSILDG